MGCYILPLSDFVDAFVFLHGLLHDFHPSPQQLCQCHIAVDRYRPALLTAPDGDDWHAAQLGQLDLGKPLLFAQGGNLLSQLFGVGDHDFTIAQI